MVCCCSWVYAGVRFVVALTARVVVLGGFVVGWLVLFVWLVWCRFSVLWFWVGLW